MDLRAKYGDWALITGASSGIGMAFARALARQRINLVLVARQRNRLETLALTLQANHRIKVVTVIADLASDDFLHRIMVEAGHLDIGILINCAGFGNSEFFHRANLKKEADMVRVNCLAPVRLTRYLVRSMVRRKRGAVIFLSSIAAAQPTPKMATYSATKVFNQYLGEALAYELKGSGVDVLTVQPGVTSTGFQKTAGMKSSRKAPWTRTSMEVVRTALNTLGKRPVAVDGCFNQWLVRLVRWMPRSLAVRLAYLWMRLFG